MGSKITLTGTSTGRIRKTDKYYTFDMIIGGSPTSPKGLPPVSSSVQYTVFVSLKAGKKAGLDKAQSDQKWVVQGEITLDLPVDLCLGEIGVIAFQIAEIPSKEKNAEKNDKVEPTTISQEPVNEIEEVAATIEPIAVTEKTSIQMLQITEINLPEKFLDAKLNPYKTAPVREWIQSHGRLDKPIDVQFINGKYWLVDGYRRYVLAKEVGLSEVPVQIK